MKVFSWLSVVHVFIYYFVCLFFNTFHQWFNVSVRLYSTAKLTAPACFPQATWFNYSCLRWPVVAVSVWHTSTCRHGRCSAKWSCTSCISTVIIRPVSGLNSERCISLLQIAQNHGASGALSCADSEKAQPRKRRFSSFFPFFTHVFQFVFFFFLKQRWAEFLKHDGARQEVHPLRDGPRLQTGSSPWHKVNPAT